MRKIGILILLFLSLIGCIGGICYLFMIKLFIVALGVAVISYASIEKISEWIKILIS